MEFIIAVLDKRLALFPHHWPIGLDKHGHFKVIISIAKTPLFLHTTCHQHVVTCGTRKIPISSIVV